MKRSVNHDSCNEYKGETMKKAKNRLLYDILGDVPDSYVAILVGELTLRPFITE